MYVKQGSQVLPMWVLRGLQPSCALYRGNGAQNTDTGCQETEGGRNKEAEALGTGFQTIHFGQII